MPLPTIHPIRDQDLPAFCSFLNRNLSDRIPPDVWAQAFQQPWMTDKPNNGFLIRDKGGEIVGGIGAIYAQRTLAGRPERFCNITSWCVLDPFRAQSMRLAMAVISQPGYHFTDLTPTEVVAGSLRFLKFQPLPSDALVIPHLPSPFGLTGSRVITDADAIEQCLPPPAARVYRDHRHFPWLRHVALGDRDSGYCHLVHKPMTLKGLPMTRVLALSDGEGFVRHFGALANHLLLRHRSLGTWIEARFLPRVPRLARRLNGYRNKMFRSDTLDAGAVDNLYSELMALDL